MASPSRKPKRLRAAGLSQAALGSSRVVSGLELELVLVSVPVPVPVPVPAVDAAGDDGSTSIKPGANRATCKASMPMMRTSLRLARPGADATLAGSISLGVSEALEAPDSRAAPVDAPADPDSPVTSDRLPAGTRASPSNASTGLSAATRSSALSTSSSASSKPSRCVAASTASGSPLTERNACPNSASAEALMICTDEASATPRATASNATPCRHGWWRHSAKLSGSRRRHMPESDQAEAVACAVAMACAVAVADAGATATTTTSSVVARRSSRRCARSYQRPR